MITGALYYAKDAELEADAARADRLLRAFNATPFGDAEAVRTRLAELLGAVGEESVVRAPFHCDYGANIRLGRGVFVNAGCVFLDVCAIELGDLCQVGPAVQIYAADHPRDAAQRRAGLELGRPVRLGRNVWVGGGAIILPGVTVGDDAIVGAGSVVTRDVPPGATVAGNPARPVRA